MKKDSGLVILLSRISRSSQKPYLVSFIVIAIVCSLFFAKTTTSASATEIPNKILASFQKPDLLKQLKQIPFDDKSKLMVDRCFLIAPGMSGTINKPAMYGWKGVKALNDGHDYQPKVVARCPSGARREVLPQKTPLFLNISIDPSDFNDDLNCSWAVDYDGNVATEVESQLNFDIRKKQAALYPNPKYNMFSVTMNDDFDKLTDGAKKDIRKNDKICPMMSNQSCDIKVGGAKARQAQPGGPSTKQHEEYWINPGDFAYKLPPPGGTAGLKMYPQFCKVSVEGKPTCMTAETQDLSASDMVDEDVAVSEDCEFTLSTAKPPEVPTDPEEENPFGEPEDNSDPDPNQTPDQNTGNSDKKPDTPGKKDTGCPPGGCNPGSGNPGGGSPGGGGGGMDELLKQLMQALQGLGQGGGNNSGNGNSNSSATPTPTPYVCVTSSTDEKVCGVDGVTYASRCVAEYENEVSVRHTGVCTSSDIVSTSTDSTVSTLSALLQQLATSGMPSNTISSVTQAIVELIGRISIGDSAS